MNFNIIFIYDYNRCFFIDHHRSLLIQHAPFLVLLIQLIIRVERQNVYTLQSGDSLFFIQNYCDKLFSVSITVQSISQSRHIIVEKWWGKYTGVMANTEATLPIIDDHYRITILVRQFGQRTPTVFNRLVERLHRVRYLQGFHLLFF